MVTAKVQRTRDRSPWEAKANEIASAKVCKSVHDEMSAGDRGTGAGSGCENGFGYRSEYVEDSSNASAITSAHDREAPGAPE